MRADEAVTDDATLEYSQTATIRRSEPTGQYRCSPTQAIHAAGLDSGGQVRYQLDESERRDLVTATRVTDGNVNPDPRDGRTYTVIDAGDDTTSALRLELPTAVFDALGIEPPAATSSSGETAYPQLDVYAGTGVLAFATPATKAIPTSALRAAFGVDAGTRTDGAVLEAVERHDGEMTVLEQIQTATPRGDPTVRLSVTRAFTAAGGDFEAITFAPALATEHGIVPAIACERDHPDAWVVSREGPNRHGATISLPAGVQNVLTGSDEGVPELAVYAADGMLGFARAADVGNATGSATEASVSSLLAIEGIGPAVVRRLARAGFASHGDLADATREDLLSVDGVGERLANRLLAIGEPSPDSDREG
jgi:hypothetical protein